MYSDWSLEMMSMYKRLAREAAKKLDRVSTIVRDADQEGESLSGCDQLTKIVELSKSDPATCYFC